MIWVLVFFLVDKGFELSDLLRFFSFFILGLILYLFMRVRGVYKYICCEYI